MHLKDHYIPVNRMIDNWRTSQQEVMPVSNLPFYAQGDYIARTDKGGHFPCRPATQLYAHKERGLYGTFNNNQALVSPTRVWKPTRAGGGSVYNALLFYQVSRPMPEQYKGTIIAAFLNPAQMQKMTPDGETEVLHKTLQSYDWIGRTSAGAIAMLGSTLYLFEPPGYQPAQYTIGNDEGDDIPIINDFGGRPFRSSGSTYGLETSSGGRPLRLYHRNLAHTAQARVDQDDFEYEIPDEMDAWGDDMDLGPIAFNPYSVDAYWWTDDLNLITANMWKSVPSGGRSGSGVPLYELQFHSGYLYDSNTKNIIQRFDEHIGVIKEYKGLDYFCGDVLYQYDGSDVTVAKDIPGPSDLYIWHDFLWVNSADGVFFYDGDNDKWYHTVGKPGGGRFVDSGNSLFTGSGAIFEDPNGALA